MKDIAHTINSSRVGPRVNKRVKSEAGYTKLTRRVYLVGGEICAEFV
jgi:hypothetical protein